MGKRKINLIEPLNNKRFKTEDEPFISKIIIRNDYDPHVYLDLNIRHVCIGNFIYTVKKNTSEKIDYSINVGLNLIQQSEVKDYIMKDSQEIMIRPCYNTFNYIPQVTYSLSSSGSYKIILNYDYLCERLMEYFDDIIVKLDQSFIIDINDVPIIVKIHNILNMLYGKISSSTTFDFIFDDNIEIYQKCINIDSKYLFVEIIDCLKSNDDADKNSSFSKITVKPDSPLIINPHIINSYIRTAYSENFYNKKIMTYHNYHKDYYGYTFIFKINVHEDNHGKYKNTYRLKDDNIIIRAYSKVNNVYISEGKEIASQIFLDQVTNDTSHHNNTIINISKINNYLKKNIKLVKVDQDYQFPGDFVFKITEIIPQVNKNLVYEINENTIINFSKNNIGTIYIENNKPKNIRFLTFKIVHQPKLVNGNVEKNNNLYESKKLDKIVRRYFSKEAVVKYRLKVPYDFQEIILIVKEICFEDGEVQNKNKKYFQMGIITKNTEFKYETKDGSLLINSNKISPSNLQKSNFLSDNVKLLEKYVGGLSNQLKIIIRNLCISRGKLKEEFLNRGLKPIKGIIFYGQPGTGKTTIAKHLGKILGCESDNFKLISGPEIFNKFLGQSEENIRNLFKPAKEAWKKYGKDSPLYMIVIDEIDAMLSIRNNNHNPVKDSVVNQFLTEIDGLVEFDNIICIGITNRLELLDSAIIRNGRLGVHVKIDIPNKQARNQIFEIHIKKIKELNRLDKVNLEELSEITENFSGADIEQVIKLASSYSLERLHEIENLNDEIISEKGKILYNDFIRAINEVKETKNFDKTDFNMYN